MLEEVWGILLVVGFDFVFFRMALPGLSVTITSKQHAGACVCCLAEDCRKEDARHFQHFFCLFLGVAAEGFFSQAFLEGGGVVHGGLWKYRDFLALPTEKSSLDYFNFCNVPTVEEKELCCESRTHSPLPQELSTKVELQA